MEGGREARQKMAGKQHVYDLPQKYAGSNSNQYFHNKTDLINNYRSLYSVGIESY